MGDYKPISSVFVRKSKKHQSPKSKDNIYPLRKTSQLKESYDYENVKDSIRRWDLYSHSLTNNWTKMMGLYETVSKLGNSSQLQECTNIINQEIIPYLSSPSMIKRDVYTRVNSTDDDIMRKNLDSFMESLNNDIESDRLLYNYDMISKRFNIDKLVSSNILFEDALTETIYGLCSLIDTYDMNHKAKFAIAAEAALYSGYKTIGDNWDQFSHINNKIILENVLDYFLINYGTLHPEKFLDEMTDTCHKDVFIGDQLDPYLNHLRDIYFEEKEKIVEESVNEDIKPDDALYGLSQDLDQYRWIREQIKIPVRESFEDLKNKFLAFVDKAKLIPTEGPALIKRGISSLLVPCRAEDLAQGTSNALSKVFYAAVTLGMFTTGGVLAGIFAMIANYIISKHAQKKYLRSSIIAWKLHRQGVVRKIQTCSDAEKKRRMEAYLDQLDNTLKKLEENYENERDESLDEINKKSKEFESLANTPGLLKDANADIDPDGKKTPAAD